jgi:uncharacterized protein DUF5681
MGGRRFEPGKSGNPKGRPKENHEVKQLARVHTKAAIARLVHWMQSDDARASVAASNSLVDRGWGKPSQAIVGEEDNPIKVMHKIERVIIYPKDRNSGDI